MSNPSDPMICNLCGGTYPSCMIGTAKTSGLRLCVNCMEPRIYRGELTSDTARHDTIMRLQLEELTMIEQQRLKELVKIEELRRKADEKQHG